MFTDNVTKVMTYYVVYIFSIAVLSNNVNLISSGVQYAIFIVDTTIMFFYVDKEITSDLRRQRHGRMPFRPWRCAQHWYLCPRWRGRQSEHQDPGMGVLLDTQSSPFAIFLSCSTR